MPSTRSVHPRELGLRGRRALELAGEVPPRPRLAIVGSRAAHRAHLEAVPGLVRTAAVRGYGIVSGGALGVDGEAHAAALSQGVAQLCVLPCGPDLLYPPRHEALFERVAATPGSGLLFAQPRGTVPARAMFASRNAIVAGLADAVVVVEAAVRSGTVLTGRLCLRGRVPLAVVSGTAGAALLAQEGAVCVGPPDVAAGSLGAWLDGLRTGAADVPVPDPWPEHLRGLRSALVRRGSRGLAVDDLDDPLASLVQLAEAEALGLVVEVAPGRYLPAR